MGILKSAKNFSLTVLGILFAIVAIPFIGVMVIIAEVTDSLINKIGIQNFHILLTVILFFVLFFIGLLIVTAPKEMRFICKKQRPSKSNHVDKLAVFNNDKSLCFILRNSTLSYGKAKEHFSEFLNIDKGEIEQKKISEYASNFLLTINDPELSISFDAVSPILLCDLPEQFRFSIKTEGHKLILTSDKNQFQNSESAKKIFKEYFSLKNKISLEEEKDHYRLSFI